MAALLGSMFFLAVIGFAIWAIVETVRPRLGRILFLLEHGALVTGTLPPQPRVMVRGRPVPVRMQVPARLRAAA